MRGTWHGVSGLAISVLLAACGAPPAAPAASPEAAAPAKVVRSKDPVKTGLDCLTAEAECGGGVCDLTLKNTCDARITCDVAVVSACKTATGVGQARGHKREAFLPRTDGTLNVAALCAEGDAVHTETSEMKCQ